MLPGICVLVVGLASCGGGGKNPSSSGLASLGIDPLGRGDGIDITQSSYTGRCYEDDTLEANRPMPPDPRDVAAEEASAVAEASRAAADAARETLEDARVALDQSLALADINSEADEVDAAVTYVVAAALALIAADAALATARIIFFNLADEEETTWADLFEDPDLSKLSIEFAPEIDLGGNRYDDAGGAILDFLSEIISEEQKTRILNFLEDTQRLAREAFDLAVRLCASCSTDPEDHRNQQDVPRETVVDPDLQRAFDAALTALDAAEEQAVEDGEAAYEARIFAETAPSEFPPCDAEELRQALDDAFCSGDFVNPISPEEEAANPGLTERLNAYVERVCEAVSDS
jgi:hypothetical protein